MVTDQSGSPIFPFRSFTNRFSGYSYLVAKDQTSLTTIDFLFAPENNQVLSWEAFLTFHFQGQLTVPNEIQQKKLQQTRQTEVSELIRPLHSPLLLPVLYPQNDNYILPRQEFHLLVLGVCHNAKCNEDVGENAKEPNKLRPRTPESLVQCFTS